MGFHRQQNLEETLPTNGTVVYLGRNVGFIFSLDVRDQCVDAQVVKVTDGQIKRNWEGGYSSDLFMHLVRHAGYRGTRSRGQREPGESSLRPMLDRWAELLRQAVQSLLSDRPDALP